MVYKSIWNCEPGWQGIETLSNRATRDLVSNLVNVTNEFPLTYQRGLIYSLMRIWSWWHRDCFVLFMWGDGKGNRLH